MACNRASFALFAAVAGHRRTAGTHRVRDACFYV